LHSRRRSRRYTIVIADRRTGVYRQLSISPRPILVAVLALFSLPVLVGLGLKWSAHAEIAQLRATAEVLDVENQSYREATGALTSQLQALQHTITDLGERAALDPTALKAIERLPSLVRSRATGGPVQAPGAQQRPSLFLPALNMPDDTFGVLRDLLYGLESRLKIVQSGVERRQALAAATPTIWPAHGWLTASYGNRPDPFTGERGFHAGIDISVDKGQQVFATADGTVRSAEWAGAYGNMVTIDHGFGIVTRYAHLHAFKVKPGTQVKRGDAIGLAGSTGRSTGVHVHYEILANGQQLNPFRFLLERVAP
jgi:murein DD-endopeptidase MepM/ murein hydrolase activator NlpD